MISPKKQHIIFTFETINIYRRQKDSKVQTQPDTQTRRLKVYFDDKML